jgi:hypothetical protein
MSWPSAAIRMHKGPSCNGLKWKWVGTAINGNLGPDYLQLRLLLSSWDCNQRRWDHIKCD